MQVRIPPDQLAKLDGWIAEHFPEGTSRPEAIRAMTMASIDLLSGEEERVKRLAAALEQGDVHAALSAIGIDVGQWPKKDQASG